MEDSPNVSLGAQKILGLIILILGLALIFYAIFSSYNIFTGKSQPPDIFKAVSQKLASPSQGAASPQEQVQSMVQQQLEAMLPADTLQKVLNLLSWSFFAWILILGGAQVAGLGINLLRK